MEKKECCEQREGLMPRLSGPKTCESSIPFALGKVSLGVPSTSLLTPKLICVSPANNGFVLGCLITYPSP